MPSIPTSYVTVDMGHPLYTEGSQTVSPVQRFSTAPGSRSPVTASRWPTSTSGPTSSSTNLLPSRDAVSGLGGSVVFEDRRASSPYSSSMSNQLLSPCDFTPKHFSHLPLPPSLYPSTVLIQASPSLARNSLVAS